MEMEERIVKKICTFCCTDETEDDKEIVEYGLALIVETMFKYLLIFLVSILIGKVKEACSFFVVFSLIRVNAGGFHCRTNLGCTLSLVSLYAISLLAECIVLADVIVLVLFAICFVVCAIFAPSSTENNPIVKKNIRLRKKVAALVLLVCSVVEYYWTVVGITKGALLVTYLGVAVLVLILEEQSRR